MNAFHFLILRREGPVEYVTLNRPKVRNAFNDVVIRELTQWAQGVATDGQVRVAVLAGAGPVLCAGADLAWMPRMATYSREENVQDALMAAQMYAALDRLPVPLVTRAHGAAFGGGAGLLAVSDIVVADTAAVFGFTEVRLGIIPAVISPYVLAKIGPSAARELLLTGMRFDAARAKEIGLVHDVVADDVLDARVGDYVRELLGAAPEAIAAAKELLRNVAGRPAHEVIGMTADALAARRVSEEGREGLRAFLEKRKAMWDMSQ